MHDLSGTRIDRYAIEAELGRGGMARVYRARDTKLDRVVALKVLSAEMTADGDSVTRFLREARAAASLDHPNIVPIHDTGQSDGYYFIAMRYIDGCTLRQRLSAGLLDHREAGDIIMQLASALDHAHRHGVMHRDIKPENVLIDSSGVTMLTDFGVASAADELSVTATGKVVGTPVYMAPEQLRGEPASARSEVYALGILAYELLTGTTPFAGRPAYAVMLAHLDERPRPVDQVVEGIAPSVAVVLDRALEKNPAARFDSAGELASRLAAALIGSPDASVSRGPAATWTAGSAAPTVVGASVHSSRRDAWRRPGSLAFVSTGLVLGVFLLTFSMFSGSELSDNDGARTGTLAASGTPTAAPSPTLTAQPQEVGWERAVPVVHKGREDASLDPGTESAPQAEPVVESLVEPDESEIGHAEDGHDGEAREVHPDVPAESAADGGEDHGEAPPGPPAEHPDHQSGESPKPEKSKPEKDKPEKDKKDKPHGGGPGSSGNAPGHSGDGLGNSGNAPGKKKN